MRRVEAACVSRGADQVNEDYAAVALPGDVGALVVLDGVGGAGAGCSHGVPWFTARLGGALLGLVSTQPERTLADCLAEAIGGTADAHRETCDLTQIQTPQSTVIAVRWQSDQLDYLVLSDSILVLQASDLSVTAILDEPRNRMAPQTLARLDTLREAIEEQPEGSPGGEVASRAYLQASSELRNVEGGFFTAAAEPSAAYRALTGTLSRSEIRAVAALTDGAGNWVEAFRLGNWQDCVGVLEKEGPWGLVARVRAAESVDLDRSAYQRDKPVDDASAVYVLF
jgi:hypothetical protein